MRPSNFESLPNAEKLDLRAQLRTYDGSYARCSIAIWIFSILIIKLFQREFLPVGIVYLIYGALIFAFSSWRGWYVSHMAPIEDSTLEREGEEGEQEEQEEVVEQMEQMDILEAEEDITGIFDKTDQGSIIDGMVVVHGFSKFRTSGNIVAAMSIVTIACYVVVLVLIVKI